MPFFIFLPGYILLQELVQAAVVVGAVAGGAVAAEQVANQVARLGDAPTHTVHVEHKTIGDWGGNGITGEQRDYLLQVGYNDNSSTYSLYELKRVARYREKELLTEQSQVYIREWINDNDYSSDEERERRDRVVNCSKSNGPAGRGMKHHKGNVKTNGKTGDERRYYQWDERHDDIEVYNKRGEHLGYMDPRTGKMYKGPVSGRSISHLL